MFSISSEQCPKIIILSSCSPKYPTRWVKWLRLYSPLFFQISSFHPQVGKPTNWLVFDSAVPWDGSLSCGSHSDCLSRSNSGGVGDGKRMLSTGSLHELFWWVMGFLNVAACTNVFLIFSGQWSPRVGRDAIMRSWLLYNSGRWFVVALVHRCRSTAVRYWWYYFVLWMWGADYYGKATHQRTIRTASALSWGGPDIFGAIPQPLISGPKSCSH